jgi:hypothetical protein
VPDHQLEVLRNALLPLSEVKAESDDVIFPKGTRFVRTKDGLKLGFLRCAV